MTKEKALNAVEKAINKAYQQGMLDKEEFELQRLYDWLLDENREPANTKFTAGKTRNVAREIELLLRKK